MIKRFRVVTNLQKIVTYRKSWIIAKTDNGDDRHNFCIITLLNLIKVTADKQKKKIGKTIYFEFYVLSTNKTSYIN